MQKTRGFSLIELLIGLAILSGMSLGLFIVIQQMIRSQEETVQRDEMIHQLTNTFDKMYRELNSAYMVKTRELLGIPMDGEEIKFEGSEDSLRFVSFAHQRFIQDAPEHESLEISYYLEADPEDADRLRLMRRQSTLIDGDFTTGGRAYPVLENIKAMRIQYLPSASDEFKKAWDTTSLSSGQKMPRALKVELDIVIPPGEEITTMSMWIPIEMKDPLAF